MAQISLALYLALSTAVGPSLCCCLPGKLVALFTSAQRPLSACHHGACQGPHPKKTKGPGRPAPTPEKDCPCKESQPQPAEFTPAPPSPESESTRSLIPTKWAALGVSLGAGPLLLHSQEQPPGHGISFPFSDARDILSVLQVLRC